MPTTQPMPANDRVAIELHENGVAQVRLTRGDKMNALDPEMFKRIIEAGEVLQSLEGLRVVVLSGEGASFCAGLDTSSFGRTPSGADIRIAHPQTRMSIMELKWGLVPDMGGYALWRGVVRDDVLRELIYTNRQFTGAEAQSLGLATYVDDDPLARATAIADDIANRNPHAIRAAKRLQAGMMERDTDAILLEESIEQHAIMRTQNQMEAVMAGMQKRAPKFEDV